MKTKQHRMQLFDGIPFLKAADNTEINKSFSCCQLGTSRRTRVRLGSAWRRQHSDVVCCCYVIAGFGSRTHPSGGNQLAAAEWFVCFCFVRGFEEEDSLENWHSVFVLSWIKSVLLNLSCVSDFFWTPAVNCVSFFLFFVFLVVVQDWRLTNCLIFRCF